LVERQLTAAEYKKKKQIAKALPKSMPDDKRYAIATSTAKRVAEQTTTQTTTQQQSQKYTDAMADATKKLEDILSMVARDLNIAQMPQEDQQDFLNSAIATLASKLSVPSQVVEDAAAALQTEISTVAGGGLEGGGNAWNSKRNNKSLIGEEDDD
jgi:transcription initiation factor TFIIIB Brf1 subunit/transcription initiation factor TFIIB